MTEPRILRVETGLMPGPAEDHVLDYRVYECVPAWWRAIERALRLDLYLAVQARRAERDYDVVICGSEKVGIPLGLMPRGRPLVVLCHYMESLPRTLLARATNVARKRWARIGYVTAESRDFLRDHLSVSSDRLFNCTTARLLDEPKPEHSRVDGPILSIGVAERDYATLLAALDDLPGVSAEILPSSRFGDELRSKLRRALPPAVQWTGYVTDADLYERYRRTPFAVLPLRPTRHRGAGINVVLEAAAFSKPVIATDTGGMRSLVRHGETGLLVPPCDPAALRDAVALLAGDEQLARRMGRAARQFAEETAHPDLIHPLIAAAIRQAAAEPSGQSLVDSRHLKSES